MKTYKTSRSATVLRFALGDCTICGVSSHFNSVEIVAEINDLDKDNQINAQRIIDDLFNAEMLNGKECFLVRRKIGDAQCDYIVPVVNIAKGKWSMMGGNWADVTDNLTREMIGMKFPGHPLPIHDRVE